MKKQGTISQSQDCQAWNFSIKPHIPHDQKSIHKNKFNAHKKNPHQIGLKYQVLTNLQWAIVGVGANHLF